MNQIEKIAELIHAKNKIDSIDAELARIIKRPALIGHVGEYIAAHIFGIQLEQSANQKGYDGHFIQEPLSGKTVNIKWSAKQEGTLNITPAHLPDFYLVMTGPKSGAVTSRQTTRPWLINALRWLENRYEEIEPRKHDNFRV